MVKYPFESVQPGEHAQRVNSLFSRIAKVYDPLNRFFSLGIDAWWRRKLAAAAAPACEAGQGEEPAGYILDLAAGTMEVSLELARKYPQCAILAMDFCRPMLVAGRPKLLKGGYKRIYPLVGDGKRLPLADASIQAVTLAFGFRNILPRAAVLSEALRVLVPGGKLCILEFAGADTPILFGLYNLYLAHILPFIGKLVSRDKTAFQYLADTVASFPNAEALADEIKNAGFGCVSHTAYTAGIVTLHIAIK